MQSKKRLIILLSVVLIISLLSFAPVQTQTAQAAKPGASIVYNLYATDAFIPLADGSAVYNYGFVGGRQGVPLTYAKSVTPGGNRDDETGLWESFDYHGNGTIAGGAPAPTGGPVTGRGALMTRKRQA